MHGVAQAFRRAMAIGAAKSVSFEKKNSVKFKKSVKKNRCRLPQRRSHIGLVVSPCTIGLLRAPINQS